MLEQVILWGQIPAYAFAGTFLWLYVKGTLVSRAQLDQVQKTADTFRLAFEASQAANQKQAELIGLLTVVANTMTKVMDALPKPSVEDRENTP